MTTTASPQPSAPVASTSEERPPRPARLPDHTLWTAALVALAYFGVTAWMMLEFVPEERDSARWDHALIIYNGFAGIAFAAFGVLLGTTVQHGNLVSARAEQAKAEKETGKLKNTIKEIAKTTSPDDAGGQTASTDRTLRQWIHDKAMGAL